MNESNRLRVHKVGYSGIHRQERKRKASETNLQKQSKLNSTLLGIRSGAIGLVIHNGT